MSEISITAENFEDEVLKSELPVLVDFWAEWCGPCKMIAPAVAQLALKYEGKVKVAKVNVDEASSVASMFNISSIPTLVIFKKGEVVAQRMGAASLSVLDSFVSQNL